MKTLTVKFLEPYRNSSTPSTKEYHYLYDGEGCPQKGHFAVVFVSGAPRLVSIESVADGASVKANKYAAAIVDPAENARREEVAKKRLELLGRLEALEKQQTEIERFKRLAETNEEAAALLQQLTEINN